MMNNIVSTPDVLDSIERIVSKYHLVLERHDELGFIGSSLELPTVFSDGRTADDCARATFKALENAARSMLELGLTPPEPFSGETRNIQINIRLNSKENDSFRRTAKHHGMSISDFIRNAASEKVRESFSPPRPVTPINDIREKQTIAIDLTNEIQSLEKENQTLKGNYETIQKRFNELGILMRHHCDQNSMYEKNFKNIISRPEF